MHAAAVNGSVPIVALLLAIPGVNPLAQDRVRGAQNCSGARACLPTPRPSPLLQWGDTPLDDARSYDNDAAAALLLADPRVTAASKS